MDNISFDTSDNYLQITEAEAFMLLSIGVDVTICDVYSTKDEMNGEEIVQDVVPMYAECFSEWKCEANETVYMEEMGTDVSVNTQYFVHIEDVTLQ